MSEKEKHAVAILNLRITLTEFFVGLSHLYDCINFGKSNLDAQAIRWMNVAVGEVDDALKKVEGGD